MSVALTVKKDLFVIKPSGVEYDKLKPEDMVVVDLEGNKVEGEYNPSSDTPTHVVLYNEFPNIGGIVHTHSAWATSWAQAGRAIPCYGTTHADYIYGEVPCVRNLTKEEIEEAYEKNTGVLIADYFNVNWIMKLFRQSFAKITDRLPGVKMRMRQCTMQLYLRKLQRWHAAVN